MNKNIAKEFLIILWERLKELFVFLLGVIIILSVSIGIAYGIYSIMEYFFGADATAYTLFAIVSLTSLGIIISIIIDKVKKMYDEAVWNAKRKGEDD